MAAPEQHGGASLVPQYLFDGPQAVGGRGGADPEQAPFLQAPALPAGNVGYMGRIDQYDAPAGFQPLQGGTQQLDLAYAGPAGHEFDQGAQGPAAAGQFAVELGVAGGEGGLPPLRELRTPPQGGVDALGMQQGGGTRGLHGLPGAYVSAYVPAILLYKKTVL